MDARDRDGVEDKRQLEHLAPLFFAFLLPVLPYQSVLGLGGLSILYAVYFSPRWLRATTRATEAKRAFAPAKLYYALCVTTLIVVFKDRLDIAAAVWAILAVGDSVSNLVGRRIGSHPLPFNAHKSWEGSLAFLVSGSAGATLLMWWNRSAETPELEVIFLHAAIATFFCAVAEAMPPVIDDNITVCWVGAAIYALLAVSGLPPSFAVGLLFALVVNSISGIVARMFGWLSWRGTIAAFFFGVTVLACAGPGAFAVLAGFLLLGSLSTRVGLARKRKLNVAQTQEGQRGISNILANGLVALVLALFSPWFSSPLLAVGFTAAVATAAFDTVSTEIGQWLGRHPINLVTLRSVPVGTQGAVSVEGSLAGLLAAGVVSFIAVAAGWIPIWVAGMVVLGAVCGAFFESALSSFHRYDFPCSDEALNLYSTLFGACAAIGLWALLV